MPHSTLDLDAIVIESPCTVPWDSMTGDDVRRYCGGCRLHVHDLSEMTRDEALGLLRATNGSRCLRVWRRPDGRVITKDCARVRRALARRWRALAAAVAAVLAAVGIGGCSGRGGDGAPNASPSSERPAPPAPPPPPGVTSTMGTPSTSPAPTPPVKGATVTTGR